MAKDPKDIEFEKAMLKDTLTDPGVKFLFGKIDTAANSLPYQAIQALLADDIPKAKRCAYLWDTYKCQIPRITEVIMNSDDPAEIVIDDPTSPKTEWSFFRWLFNK